MEGATSAAKEIKNFQQQVCQWESLFNSAIGKVKQKSNQEHLKMQLSMIEGYKSKLLAASSIEENGYDLSGNESEDNKSNSGSEINSIHEEDDVKKPSEDQKKGTSQFDISKPTVEETEGLVGLSEEKTFMLATINGPNEFPLHQSKMRSKSRLKAFMLFGCPGKTVFMTHKSQLLQNFFDHSKLFVLFKLFKLSSFSKVQLMYEMLL